MRKRNKLKADNQQLASRHVKMDTHSHLADPDIWKVLVLMSEKIDNFLTAFETHYVLETQQSLLNISANFKILADALALDEEGIKLCGVRTLQVKSVRQTSLAEQVKQVLEKLTPTHAAQTAEKAAAVNNEHNLSFSGSFGKSSEEESVKPKPATATSFFLQPSFEQSRVSSSNKSDREDREEDEAAALPLQPPRSRSPISQALQEVHRKVKKT